MTAISKLNSVAESMLASSTGKRIDFFILSLYNAEAFPYSVAKLAENLDRANFRLMMEAICEYREHGETEELRYLGNRIRQRREV